MGTKINRLIIVSISLCICRIDIAQETREIACAGKIINAQKKP